VLRVERGLVGPRRRLANAQPWVSALIALALAAPNLIWQATHRLPMAFVAANIASGRIDVLNAQGGTAADRAPRCRAVVSIVLIVGLIVSVLWPELRLLA
jgi:hypothetical protein